MMTYDATDNLDNSSNENEVERDIDVKSSEIKDAKVRKRIDDLLEQKRLKELLDDTDDW